MRVALDYTPAISQIAGVGRYTRSLFAGLREVAPADTDWTLWYPHRTAGSENIPVGDRISSSPIPLSARWSSLIWHRLGIPLNLERFTGNISLAHGTDFVVPPSRAPSLVTIHDLSYALLPQLAFPRLRAYLERSVPRSINRAAKIVAVSETTKRDLCEYYEISPNRVEVIHHAADPLFLPPSDTDVLRMIAQFGLRRPYYIMVGTIEPRKDHETLLRAFERVHTVHPEASLVIVGRTGWLADGIMTSIRNAAARMPVYHLQGITDDALPALYGGSSAMVYTSRYEGFGLPLLEAMASGAPVITTDTPAHLEVASDAACYARPEDDEQLAVHMLKMIEDPSARAALVDAGRKRASQFSWDVAAREHLRIYRELANG